MPHFFSYRSYFLFLSLTFSVILPVLAKNNTETNRYIVAIIDADTRIGKEQKTAIEIAIADFNNTSKASAVSLTVNNSGGDPFRAASTAKELINGQQVTVIIGPSTWQETALVADIGNRSQVPILSFATSAVPGPLTSFRWPHLVRMAGNDLVQMRCVAAIVESYEWRRVIAIYEDNGYVGSSSGAVTLLGDALRNIGSEIEARYAFPPLSSLSLPKSFIRDELQKLNNEHCKIFVVVEMPLPLAAVIFAEAKQQGMMEKGYVWITTDGLTSLLDSVNSSVISPMDGVLGIKTYFNKSDQPIRRFRNKFLQNFQSEYREAVNHEPSIFALRAYDAISVLGRNLEGNPIQSQKLLSSILSSNFKGLSGEISFKDGELATVPIFQIVNIFNESYREIGFWTPQSGFSKIVNGPNIALAPVHWPGRPGSVPKGWATKRLKIGVPGNCPFPQFVTATHYPIHNVTDVTGFSIDVFEEVVKALPYDLPHEFEVFDGTYDDLVKQVYFKKYDAVVGDIAILAERSRYVQFSQPYVESGLTMLVPTTKQQGSRWPFLKPFSKALWTVTGATFIYTAIVVWFLEHPRNPDFRGPWRNQLGTMLSFTFSTLFFVHREKLRSNFSRIVIAVWLLVVFVLTSSYTASLTSMLTIAQLEPKVTDIESLKRSNAMVGCTAISYVCKYLEEVLNFNPRNIKKIHTGDDFAPAFDRGEISAAFLLIPYVKLFLAKYCKGYTTTGPTYRSEGFGFVFRKGSSLADDISKAILTISENGKLKELEDKLFSFSTKCPTTGNNVDNSGTLGHNHFWVLFAVTGAVSTVILIVFFANLLRKFRKHCMQSEGKTSSRDDSVWERTVMLARYFDKGLLHIPRKASKSSAMGKDDWRSVDIVSNNYTPQHPQSSPISISRARETA